MSSLYRLRLEYGDGVDRRDVLLVFLAEDMLEPDRLSSLVDEAVERDLAPDEMIVVVRETARTVVAKALRSSDELVGMRARLSQHAVITVVGFGPDGAETGREVAKGDDADVSKLTLAEIGRRAVTSIFNEHGGFVEANGNYHFKNPSGRHTDRFIRLSNLLVSSAEISVIAMTALPLVAPDSVEIHVDTPSMFSVVAGINEHLRSLAPKRPALRCENFRSYFNVDKHDFTSGGPACVLISASSSGTLAARISGRGVPAERIGHLLFLGPETKGVRLAVDLVRDEAANPDGIKDERETFAEGKCRLCDDGSIEVPLVGDQFDMGGPEFDPLTVMKDDAPRGLSETMNRIAKSGALGISLKIGAERRQFLIDADNLLAWSKFDDRLGYFARRFVPSTTRECIVLDAASQKFAERLMAKAAVGPRLIGREDVDALELADQDGGTPLDGLPIAIVAAAIESGRALRDVSRDLRKSRPHSPQIYLVGVAKSPNTARRKELERTLVQTQTATQHAFAVIEDLLLPPSDAPNAWVAELAFLNRLVAQGAPLSQTLQDRKAVLEKNSTPLRDNLFLANDDFPLAIQPGFVFWPASLSREASPAASQADVFYTVSSVLQRLRTNPPKPGARALRSNWFQQTRLDPANLGRFNDGVIQASLLRAARPTEIDFSRDDAIAVEACRVVRRIVEASHRPRGEAAGEILIALGSKRLRLPKEELETLLQPRENHPPLVAELAAACKALLL